MNLSGGSSQFELASRRSTENDPDHITTHTSEFQTIRWLRRVFTAVMGVPLAMDSNLVLDLTGFVAKEELLGTGDIEVWRASWVNIPEAYKERLPTLAIKEFNDGVVRDENVQRKRLKVN